MIRNLKNRVQPFLRLDPLISILVIVMAAIIFLLEVHTSTLIESGTLAVLGLLALSNLITIVSRFQGMETSVQESTHLVREEVVPALASMKSAGEIGIRQIFEKRYRNEEAQRALIDYISKAERQICISAVAVPGFFVAGRFASVVWDRLHANIRIRVLLLDPASPAAAQRAAIEIGRLTTGDIEETIDGIQNHMEDNLNVEARLYNFPPMAFTVFIDDRWMFLEQYHFGRLETWLRGSCIGGRVPLLLIENDPRKTEHVFNIMQAHWKYLWEQVAVAPYSLRRVLSRIVIREYLPDSCRIVLENTCDFQARTAGWKLRDNRERTVEFPDIVLKPNRLEQIQHDDFADLTPPLTLENRHGITLAIWKEDPKWSPYTEGYITREAYQSRGAQ